MTKIAKNFWLEAQNLLRIYDLSCYDFRKSEAQGVENGVTYKKMCTIKDERKIKEIIEMKWWCSCCILEQKKKMKEIIKVRWRWCAYWRCFVC